MMAKCADEKRDGPSKAVGKGGERGNIVSCLARQDDEEKRR